MSQTLASEKLEEFFVFRTIYLDYPIKDGEGNEITALQMRRAKARDLRNMQNQKGEAAQEFYLIATLTGLVIEDIDELDIADYAKVQKALKDMQAGKSA